MSSKPKTLRITGDCIELSFKTVGVKSEVLRIGMMDDRTPVTSALTMDFTSTELKSLIQSLNSQLEVMEGKGS